MRPAIITALLLVGTFARAATPSPEAKAHFEEGDKAYKLGDFTRAIREYQASFELYPAPLLLYDIAQAYRMLGDNERALFSYKQYLVDAPPGDFSTFAEEQVGKLEPLVDAERKSRKSPPTTTAKPDATPTDKQPREGLQPAPSARVQLSAPSEAINRPAPHRWWILGVVGGIVVLGAVAGVIIAVLTPKDATIPGTSVGNTSITF